MSTSKMKPRMKALLTIILLILSSTLLHAFVNLSHTVQMYQGELVAYWGFDEGEGQIAFDRSGHYNDLALLCTGDHCSPPRWVTGVTSYAIAFNGMGQYGIARYSTSLTPERFTVAFWVKLNVHNRGNIQVIAQLRGPGEGLGRGWIVRDGGTGRLEVLFYDGETYTARLTTPSSANEWMHIAVTFAGSVAKLYKNGSLVDVDQETALVHTRRRGLYLGAFEGYGGFLSGVIDNFRLYKTVLPESAIEMLHRNTQ